jgi:hypothetical protein
LGLGLPSAISNQSEIRNLKSAISPIPTIDNPDDPGVNRRLHGMKGKARLLAADEEHVLSHAGAHCVDGNQRPSGRLAIRRQRLNHQQGDPDEVLVLASGDHFTDDASQLHDLGDCRLEISDFRLIVELQIDWLLQAHVNAKSEVPI